MKKGSHHTEESKQKLRLLKLGSHHTEESKKKIGKASHLRVRSKETRTKIGLSKLNDKNPMWKGDAVKRVAGHNWIRRRKPKPELCEQCKKNPPFDLANISGEYKRDISDYQWLCRKCHMESDNRLANLIALNRSKEHRETLRIKFTGKKLWDAKPHPNLGKHLSEETKKKIRDAQLGEKSFMFGKHRSEETKQKLRKHFLGIPRSEETIRKMRESFNKPEVKKKMIESKLGKNNPMFGKHFSEEHDILPNKST